MPLSEMGATWSNDIWGWTDPQTGKRVRPGRLGNGTGFVDVSEPASPKYLGKLPTHSGRVHLA